MKKLLSILLTFSLLSTGAISVCAEGDKKEGILNWYAQNTTLDSWWDIIALYDAGVDLSTYTLPQIESDKLSAPQDYSSAIFSLVVQNKNCRDFNGVNLASQLANLEDENGMFTDDPNGQAYAILALDCVGQTYDKASALEYLASLEIPGGGFGYYDTPDPDTTAIDLIALSQDSAYSDVISRGLEYLANEQQPDASFASWGFSNANSTAMAISVLATFGTLDNEAYIKSGFTALDALDSFASEDGSFSWDIGGESNALATAQALMAYNDAKKGKSVFLRISYQEPTPKKRHKSSAKKPPVQTSESEDTTPVESKDTTSEITEPENTTSLELEDTTPEIIVPAFSDEDEISDWAKDSVVKMSELQVFVGDNGAFKPKASMTRAELSTILCKLLSLDNSGQIFFSDVSDSDWFYQSVSAVCSAKIMSGISDSEFNPTGLITREMLATVITNAFKLTNSQDATFSDFSEVSEWAKDSVCAVSESGIIIGDGGFFSPKMYVTREMAATVIARALDSIQSK